MRSKYRWFLLAVLGSAGLASTASAEGSYVALKAGIYSPSATFDVSNINVESTFEGDTETGVDAEIAVGHYFLPTVVLELGAGYFKSKGTFDASGTETNDFQYDVIPIILSGKFMIPIGSVSPYGEVGIGAYFTSLDVSNNANSFSGNVTFGIHAGAGINVPVSDSVFLGLEARYVWAEPDFGGETIKINDNEYALDGFTLNGFTTTLGVGFVF